MKTISIILLSALLLAGALIALQSQSPPAPGASKALSVTNPPATRPPARPGTPGGAATNLPTQSAPGVSPVNPQQGQRTPSQLFQPPRRTATNVADRPTSTPALPSPTSSGFTPQEGAPAAMSATNIAPITTPVGPAPAMLPPPALSTAPMTTSARPETRPSSTTTATPGLPSPPATQPSGVPAITDSTMSTPTTIPTPGTTLPAGLPAAIAQNAGGPMTVPDPDTILPPMSIRFPNAPLQSVFNYYAELVNRTLILHPTVQQQQAQATITLNVQTALTKQEAVQALDTTLAMNNITMIPMGTKFVLAVPMANALQEGAAFSMTDLRNLPEASQYITEIVRITNALPSEVKPLLTSVAKMPNGIVDIDASQTLVLRDYAVNVKRMMEIIKQIDVPIESVYRLEVIPIRYGKVEDIYNVMSGLIGGGGGGGMAPAAGRPGVSSSRTSRSSRSGASGQRGRLRSTTPGQPMQPGQPTTPAAGQTSFQQRLQQIVSRAAGGDQEILGDAKIIPDDRANSLVVYANRHDMEMITNIVSKLDVALAQVLIEAVIIDVNLNDSLTYGVSAAQNPRTSGKWTYGGGINNGQGFLNSITNFGGGLPSGFSYFGKLAGDLDLAVTALAANGRTTVLQRPRIQTTHAQPATFFNGSTVPYITSTYYGGFSSVGPSASYSQLEVGVGLDVTPYITPDKLVVMEVNQTIDELAGTTKIGNDEVPNTTSRTATSVVSVRDGETIMLGGFIRSSKTKARSGVPLLKDIPLLGALFRSSSANNQRSELIVLMRPTVLMNPQDASEVAQRETETLPGVKQAQEDFKQQEEEIANKAKRASKRKK